jgi:hypothetical protein
MFWDVVPRRSAVVSKALTASDPAARKSKGVHAFAAWAPRFAAISSGWRAASVGRRQRDADHHPPLSMMIIIMRAFSLSVLAPVIPIRRPHTVDVPKRYGRDYSSLLSTH